MEGLMISDINKSKKVYLEMMRIIACALVIFNHTKGYMLFSVSTGGEQFFNMCLTMITRINAPLFFMISGALLYSKNEEWIYVFKKRFLRIVYLLLLLNFIIMFLYSIKSFIKGTAYELSLATYLHGILQNQMDGAYAYWYLYSYLGILFILPLLQRMAKEVTEVEILALLALHFITSSFLPIVNIFLIQKQLPTFSLCENFNVPFAYDKAFFYTILGYYIENYIDITKLKKIHLCGLSLAGGAGIVISNWCTYIDAAINGTYSQGYVQLFDYLSTIVVFILIKYMFVVAFPKLNEGAISKTICLWGSLTLGIYVFDPCIKIIMYGKYESWAEAHFPIMIVSLGWILISMFLGGFITFVSKKIPIIKQII